LPGSGRVVRRTTARPADPHGRPPRTGRSVEEPLDRGARWETGEAPETHPFAV